MSTSITLSVCLIVAFSSIITAQDCDFDGNSFCGWKVGTEGTWRLGQIASSNNTGPVADPGVDYFIYLDPETGATITSPVLDSNSDIDFKFWYHMYGATIGTLNVSMQDSDNELTLLFTRSGDQGDEWKESSIHIKNPLHNRIIIEGVRGSGTAGVMALDDFIFTNSSSAMNGSCNFEKDLCGYHQMLPDEYDWVRRTGTEGTGPSSDHTFNNATLRGFYMTTDGSSYSEGSAARMVTPIIMPSPAICVSFWYYMYGDSSEKGVGLLNVYKMDVDSNVTESLLNLLDRPNHSSNWDEMRINITRSEQEFQIVFEAIQGSSKSDIAIDDVTIVRNSWCHDSTGHTRLPILNLPTKTSINTESSEPSKAKFTTTPVHPTTSPGTKWSKIDSDDKFVTIVLACGLTFWGVIFSLIIINMLRSHHLRQKVLFDQLEGPNDRRYESSYVDLTSDNLSLKDLGIDNEYISVKSQMKGLVDELARTSVKKATFTGDVCTLNVNPGVGKDDRPCARAINIHNLSAPNEIDTLL